MSYTNFGERADRGAEGSFRRLGLTLARHSDGEPNYLAHVKQLCGARIEFERRRRGLSQAALGGKAGIGAAWIRHLEGGYDRVRLDDHLICLDALGLSPLTLLMPILFALRDRQCPLHLLMGDLHQLEAHVIDAIIGWNDAEMRTMWSKEQGAPRES